MKKIAKYMMVVAILIVISGGICAVKMGFFSKTSEENDKTTNIETNIEKEKIEEYSCIEASSFKEEEKIINTYKQIYTFSIEENKIVQGHYVERIEFPSLEEYNRFLELSKDSTRKPITYDDEKWSAVYKDEDRIFVNEDTGDSTFSDQYIEQLEKQGYHCSIQKESEVR